MLALQKRASVRVGTATEGNCQATKDLKRRTMVVDVVVVMFTLVLVVTL